MEALRSMITKGGRLMRIENIVRSVMNVIREIWVREMGQSFMSTMDVEVKLTLRTAIRKTASNDIAVVAVKRIGGIGRIRD